MTSSMQSTTTRAFVYVLSGVHIQGVVGTSLQLTVTSNVLLLVLLLQTTCIPVPNLQLCVEMTQCARESYSTTVSNDV
jgi:hypothetical protein